MPDVHSNFAVTTVATAPSTATAGTSLVVAAGKGALFPTVPFNATVWPTGAQPTSTTAEIVRVTARSTDTLTIVRAQESSSARTVVIGDQIAATVTAKTLTDVESNFSPDLALSDMVAAQNTNTIAAATSAYVGSDYEIAGTRYANFTDSTNGSTNNNDNVYAQAVTIPATGFLSGINVHSFTGGFSVSGNMRAGIYTNTSGAPGALLYTATAQSFVSTDTVCRMPITITEITGTTVWVAVQTNINGWQVGTSSIGETGLSRRDTGGAGPTYAGGLPDPFGTADLTGGALQSFYAIAEAVTEIGVGSTLEIG